MNAMTGIVSTAGKAATLLSAAHYTQDSRLLRLHTPLHSIDPAGAGVFLTDLTIQLPVVTSVGKDTIGGPMVLASYEGENPHDGPATFSATFKTNGAWTLT